MMESKTAHWLWYPGDLELYHALKQNFARVERGMGWPAYWKSSSFRQRVVFWRTYELREETVFAVAARGTGFVRVVCESGAYKYRFGDRILCGPGKVTVVIHVGRIEALPAAYVDGEVICSDAGWMADDYSEALPAAMNDVFTDPAQDPSVWPYVRKRIAPVRMECVSGGTLYMWEEELTAALRIEAAPERLAEMTVYPGESRDEALDTEHCYLHWKPEKLADGAQSANADNNEAAVGLCPRCAVRWAFIPGDPVRVEAVYEYVDFPVRAAFACDDPVLNQIWQVAERTFRLCSGIFFIDGIKRDQWIWSGDMYQCLFVNRYLLADPEIEKRTLIALRGSDPVTTHINTIADYSLLWVLAVMEHYHSAGDTDFLRGIYPKIGTMLAFFESKLDENGFLTAGEKDWIYIDWAEIDKEGPCAGEQMLLSAVWNAASRIASLLHKTGDAERYAANERALKAKIRQNYWSEEMGAFIDSFVSGKNHVSRQTNILALRTGNADQHQIDGIFKNVLYNDAVPPISTPYFQFYALDALCGQGEYRKVLGSIRDYWGGMLERGAVTFWEEFDPSVTGTAQYDMYGDRFGKSLCHAWAASPIYLLSRYFVGLDIRREENLSFVLTPQLVYFRNLNCVLPVGMDGASVEIQWDGERLIVTACDVCGYVQAFGSEVFVESGSQIVLQEAGKQTDNSMK